MGDYELAVALRQTERPDDMSPEGTPVFEKRKVDSRFEQVHGEIGDDERKEGDSLGTMHCRNPSVLKGIWTVPKFKQRLEVLRDLYKEVGERDAPWGEPGDLNPWEEIDAVPSIRATRRKQRASEPDAMKGEPSLHHGVSRHIRVSDCFNELESYEPLDKISDGPDKLARFTSAKVGDAPATSQQDRRSVPQRGSFNRGSAQ